MNRNVKYQMLTLQNQKAADKKYKYFSKNFIYKTKLQLQFISVCFDKSNRLPHDGLRAISSVKIKILLRTSSGRQLK